MTPPIPLLRTPAAPPRRAPLLASALLLGACAGAASAPKPGTKAAVAETSTLRARRDVAAAVQDLPVPVAHAWAALPAAFADLGYQGKPSADAAAREYITPPLKIRGRLYPESPNSAFVDCGRTAAGGAAADEYSVTFAVFVRVTPRGPDASAVEVRVDGGARERTGSSNSIRCRGTGRLEEMFMLAIARRVAIGASTTRGA